MAKRDVETKSENDVRGQEGRLEATRPSPSSRSGFDLADLSALGGPRFIMTVDTEEEFDWTKPFARDGFGTTHLQAVPKFQALCDEFGIKPCYLVDYPIIDDPVGVEMLGGYANENRAEIGVQLHPWVNPPFAEVLNVRNSYACNLPEAIESAKLTALFEAIRSRTGITPDAYRAGRYGAGRATAQILEKLGISIDTSVRARFDYHHQGGPTFTDHPVKPYWIKRGSLLELPLTTVFSGAMRSAGNLVFGKWFGSHAARSLLARSNMLERIALTPEGIPLDKAIRAIDLALEEQIPILNLSFHSPSLAVGHTPYVRTQAQLDELYRWFSGVFVHLQQCGVRPTTMAEVKIVSQLKTSA